MVLVSTKREVPEKPLSVPETCAPYIITSQDLPTGPTNNVHDPPFPTLAICLIVWKLRDQLVSEGLSKVPPSHYIDAKDHGWVLHCKLEASLLLLTILGGL